MEIAKSCVEDGLKGSDSRVKQKQTTIKRRGARAKRVNDTSVRESLTALYVLIVFTLQILIMAATLALAVNSQMRIASADEKNKVTHEVLSSLLSSVGVLATAQDIISRQVASLQSAVNTLNSSLNLFQGCFQNTQNCTLTEDRDLVWSRCQTPSISASLDVSQ